MFQLTSCLSKRKSSAFIVEIESKFVLAGERISALVSLLFDLDVKPLEILEIKLPD
jgi:hypothetical protein